MGLMKQLKHLKAPAADVPERTSPYAVPTVAAIGPDFDPIAGVSLDLYAEISRELAAVGYDPNRAPGLAAARGVSTADWEAAVAGWNARMHANPGVGQRFNALYTRR